MTQENGVRGAHPSDPAEGSRQPDEEVRADRPGRSGSPDDRPHATVQASDVRELLEAGESGARLVLREGRVLVASDGGGDAQSGALTVITRQDLLDRLGDRAPDETWLTEQATLLDTEISKLGA